MRKTWNATTLSVYLLLLFYATVTHTGVIVCMHGFSLLTFTVEATYEGRLYKGTAAYYRGAL